MMRNNYAASGLKGIRVAVGMYNRRNGNLETGEITCRMFADRNSEPERFENENTVILYNSIRQVEAPSMQDIVSIFYAKQMQAFSEQQLDASCLNQHTKEGNRRAVCKPQEPPTENQKQAGELRERG